MTPDDLTTIYMGNAIAIALLLTLLFSNRKRLNDSKDFKIVFKMLLVTCSACIVDAVSYTIDGRAGLAVTIAIYITNSWLYISTMLVGKLWFDFLVEHINIPVNKALRGIMNGIFALGTLALVINIFYPIVFSAKDNIYERTYLYYIYVIVAGFYMFESVYLYYNTKKKAGIYSFFTIYVFIVPVVLGIIIQSLFYGISVIWPGVAIAIAGIISSMNNEIIFVDKLTGIYNRVYLEYMQKDIYKKKNAFVTGIMIDVNDFKSINDRFGHATGDEALITTADILTTSVANAGTVMRYAGDEFVVLLNTVEEERVEMIIKNINNAFNYYNERNEKPYKLSISYGYAALDLKNQTMNDFMNTIDKKMYEYKDKYYRISGKDRRK